jgi:outer membrane protein OmpA-like peptidoglycan-associated protein
MNSAAFRSRLKRFLAPVALLALSLGLCSTLVQADDVDRAQQLFEQGRQTRDVDQRIALLRESIRLQPSYGGWYFLGRAYQEKVLQQGAGPAIAAEAVDAFEKALRLASNRKQAAMARGRAGEAMIAAGRGADGVALLRQSIKDLSPAPAWMEQALLRGQIDNSQRLVSAKEIVDALSGDKRAVFGVEQRSIDLPVNFATNRYEIDSLPTGKAQADELAAAVGEMGRIDQKYMIVGHTDVRGSKAHNDRLSQNRADSVKAYIAGRVPNVADLLCAVGRGEDLPSAQLVNAADENHPDNAPRHQINRRVQVEIVDYCY